MLKIAFRPLACGTTAPGPSPRQTCCFPAIIARYTACGGIDSPRSTSYFQCNETNQLSQTLQYFFCFLACTMYGIDAAVATLLDRCLAYLERSPLERSAHRVVADVALYRHCRKRNRRLLSGSLGRTRSPAPLLKPSKRQGGGRPSPRSAPFTLDTCIIKSVL